MSYKVLSNAAEHDVEFYDEMTFKNHDEFFAIVDELAANPRERWVFDLGHIEFLDSAGLGMLIGAREKVPGTEIVIRGANQEIQDVMMLARFEELFTIEA